MAVQPFQADIGSYPGQRDVSASASEFITVELTTGFDLDAFICTRDPEAVRYLQVGVWEYVRKGCGLAFVRRSPHDPHKIWGYYHLVGSSLTRALMQNRDQRHVPCGSPVPVYHIAYVARDDRAEPGSGAALVIDAARRARTLFPTWGLSLHAKNAKLVGFYTDLGFKIIRPLKQQQETSDLPQFGPFHMYAPHGAIIVD